MFQRLIKLALLCAGVSLPQAFIQAAEITHQTIVDDIEGIAIDGDISITDVQKFRDLSIRYKKVVVVLSSNGGALLPAIEIGKIIKIAGYATLVPEDAICASSCALIWVAGSTRLLSPKGRVGFHASYRDNNGRLEESGVANALIGNYLTLLNFPEKAIIFATRASPDKISWLNKTNKGTAGIDFADFDLGDDKPVDKAQTVIPAPPVLRVEAPPPPASSSLPKKPTTTITRADSGENWIYYADNKSGTILYYDRNSIRRTGSYIKVWVKKDHSKDPSIAKRESKELWTLWCDGQSASLLMYVDYDKNGSVTESNTIPSYRQSFDPLVPGSVGMALWEALCN